MSAQPDLGPREAIAHLADHDRPHLTACGEPWQPWQDPDRGATVDEVIAAVPSLTQTERAQLRAEDRATPRRVRQCQACQRLALRTGRAVELAHKRGPERPVKATSVGASTCQCRNWPGDNPACPVHR